MHCLLFSLTYRPFGGTTFAVSTEMGTVGGISYHDCSNQISNIDLNHFPYRYNMMSCCWDDDMTKRPDFPIIVKKLRRILKK